MPISSTFLRTIAGTITGDYDMGEGIDQKLSIEEMKQMAGKHVCFGLHGYRHENFRETPLKDLREAMQRSIAAFEQHGIPYTKVLAYPYGSRPAGADRDALKKKLSALEIKAAFRIGNKPQEIPASDVYELRRIDVRGEDTLADFGIKIRKGKLKPF